MLEDVKSLVKQKYAGKGEGSITTTIIIIIFETQLDKKSKFLINRKHQIKFTLKIWKMPIKDTEDLIGKISGVQRKQHIRILRMGRRSSRKQVVLRYFYLIAIKQTILRGYSMRTVSLGTWFVILLMLILFNVPASFAMDSPNSISMNLSEKQELAIRTFISLHDQGDQNFQFKGEEINPCNPEMLKNMRRYISVPNDMLTSRVLATSEYVWKDYWENNFKDTCKRGPIPHIGISQVTVDACKENKICAIVETTIAMKPLPASASKEIFMFKPISSSKLEYYQYIHPRYTSKRETLSGVTRTNIPALSKITYDSDPVIIESMAPHCLITSKAVFKADGTIALDLQKMDCTDTKGRETKYDIQGFVLIKDGKGVVFGFGREGTPAGQEVEVVIDQKKDVFF